MKREAEKFEDLDAALRPWMVKGIEFRRPPDQDRDEWRRFWTGVKNAVTISAVLWIALLAAVLLLTSCTGASQRARPRDSLILKKQKGAEMLMQTERAKGAAGVGPVAVTYSDHNKPTLSGLGLTKRSLMSVSNKKQQTKGAINECRKIFRV